MSQEFCLKWNNHTSLMKEFKEFLAIEAMVDVTLACDGVSLKAHKIILSACSPFFKNLFLENPCKHPIIILKDVKYTDLQAILQFIYHGRISIPQDQLSSLIKTAKTLGVKGLGEAGSQDKLFDSEIENPFANEYENQSNRVSNLESTQQQSVYDLSDNEVYHPEIKQELSDKTSSNAIIAASHVCNVNTFIPNQESQAAENFQDFTPNLHGQTSTTSSLTRDSSTQTSIMFHQNDYNDMASLASVVPSLKHSGVFVSLSQLSNSSSGATQEELANVEPTSSSTLTLAEHEAVDKKKENKDDDKHCNSVFSSDKDRQDVKVKKRKRQMAGTTQKELANVEPTSSSILTLAEREAIDKEKKNKNDDEHCSSAFSSDNERQDAKVKKTKKRMAASHPKKLKRNTKMVSRSSMQTQCNSQKQTVIDSGDSGSKKKADKTKNSGITKRQMKFHECELCTFKTISMKKLKIHLRIEHKPLPCNVCDEVCRNRDVLRWHKKRWHTGNPPIHKCFPECRRCGKYLLYLRKKLQTNI